MIEPNVPEGHYPADDGVKFDYGPEPAAKAEATPDTLAALKRWMSEDSVAGNGDYDQGLMCGVEDRGYQKDGYSAMRYGYDRALERVSEYIDPLIDALECDRNRLQRENEELALTVAECGLDYAEMRRNYDGACKMVAEMHAAAVGEVRGPDRGVVEDIADLRTRAKTAEAELAAMRAAQMDAATVLLLDSRALLYTDTLAGNQVCRDDMWAITTAERDSVYTLLAAKEVALAALNEVFKSEGYTAQQVIEIIAENAARAEQQKGKLG